MALIICPICNMSYEVSDNIIGQKAECANCHTIFVAKAEPPQKIVKLDLIPASEDISFQKTMHPNKNKYMKRIAFVISVVAIIVASLLFLFLIDIFTVENGRVQILRRHIFSIGKVDKREEDAPNSANALYERGLAYKNGDGIPKNYIKAVQCFTKAAEQGDAKAQNALGNCFYTGIGVKVDYAEAVKWYRMAADLGYAPAQYNLGYSFYEGKGVSKDYAEAVWWCRKAADQGHAEAECFLGFSYCTGTGVTKDTLEGIKWYIKSAEQGYSEAQYNLGIYYEEEKRDYTEAVKWYRKAAEQGNVEAQYKTGFYLYFNSYDVKPNYVEAVKWLRKATAQGHVEAKRHLRVAERHLSINHSPVSLLGVPDVVIVQISDEISWKMIKVEAGSIKKSEGYDGIYPELTMTKDYYIGQTYVTVEQYHALNYVASDYKYYKDDSPIEVSWGDAMSFCKRLNSWGKAPDGWEFTLPTEKQWEYASRYGKERMGDKQKELNDLGLYDMGKKVWEWCLDSSRCDNGLAGRVIRLSTRSSVDSEYSMTYNGFRLALVPVQ